MQALIPHFIKYGTGSPKPGFRTGCTHVTTSYGTWVQTVGNFSVMYRLRLYLRTVRSSYVGTASALFPGLGGTGWATKVALAAICLVFPALVLGYNSFNVSMYHVPVPT